MSCFFFTEFSGHYFHVEFVLSASIQPMAFIFVDIYVIQIRFHMRSLLKLSWFIIRLLWNHSKITFKLSAFYDSIIIMSFAHLHSMVVHYRGWLNIHFNLDTGAKYKHIQIYLISWLISQYVSSPLLFFIFTVATTSCLQLVLLAICIIEKPSKATC